MINNDIFEIGTILNDFEYSLGKLAPSSKYIYMSCVKSFLKNGYNIRRIQDYNDFLIKHTINKRSAHYYDIMIKFVKWYFKTDADKELKKDIIYVIQSLGKKVKDPKKQVIPINKIERIKIIKNISSWKHKLIAWIQEETGVRAGDVLRLKRHKQSNDSDIKYGIYKNSEGKELVMQCYFTQKGDKKKVIPIFDINLINEIEEYLSNTFIDEEYIFCSRDIVHKDNRTDNFRIEKRNYDLYWKDLGDTCERLGYDRSQFTTHDIRRNFAIDTWIEVLDKKDIEGLRKAMGHSHVDTTVRYLRGAGLDRDDIFAKKHKLNQNIYK